MQLQEHTTAAAMPTAICNLILQFNGVFRGSARTTFSQRRIHETQHEMAEEKRKEKKLNTSLKTYQRGVPPSDFLFPYLQRLET